MVECCWRYPLWMFEFSMLRVPSVNGWMLLEATSVNVWIYHAQSALGECLPTTGNNWTTCRDWINQSWPQQACESHDHDHQWTDYAMVWLPQDKRKLENKVARHVWDFDCLHFAQYILISPHGIDCKQTWCKKIYRMDRDIWLKPLPMVPSPTTPQDFHYIETGLVYTQTTNNMNRLNMQERIKRNPSNIKDLMTTPTSNKDGLNQMGSWDNKWEPQKMTS